MQNIESQIYILQKISCLKLNITNERKIRQINYNLHTFKSLSARDISNDNFIISWSSRD